MRHLHLILCINLVAAFASAGSLYVDDNAANDPAPGNPAVSDPKEDGTQAHPFDAIQEAIDFITDPNIYNEVIILPGTYTGDGNRDIDFKGKPITVRGTNPNDPNTVAATIIDCQGTEAQPHRGFYFHAGETESSVLIGLTITNGFIDIGGGIFCDHSSPAIHNCVIRNNTATDESYFDKGGGGILCSYSNAVISSCTIGDNSGGGILCDRGKPIISSCEVIGNNNSRNGGGLCGWYSNSEIVDSVFAGNRGNAGAAIAFYYESPLISNCSLIGNSSVHSGGSVYCFGGSIIISNSQILGNKSGKNGGGGRFKECQVNIVNSTIVGNRADQRGGGIFCDNSTIVTIINTILWGNLATKGGQIAFPPFNDDWEQRDLHVRFSNIQDGKEAIEGEWTRLDWQDGNIDTDPLFADPGQWDGDTWIEGDYHLKSYAGRWEPVSKTWVTDSEHSPCIDAGNPSSDYANEPQYNGKRINMGANGNTEFASKAPNCPEPPIGDLDEDCKVTFADFAIFATHWMDCNLDPPIACD